MEAMKYDAARGVERNRALHADTIKKLENAREVAATANAAALAAEKAKDAVEAETERLLGMLDPKRPRTEAAAEDPDAATLVADDMDLATHRREHTRVMHRRCRAHRRASRSASAACAAHRQARLERLPPPRAAWARDRCVAAGAAL